MMCLNLPPPHAQILNGFALAARSCAATRMRLSSLKKICSVQIHGLQNLNTRAMWHCMKAPQPEIEIMVDLNHSKYIQAFIIGALKSLRACLLVSVTMCSQV